MAGRVILSIGFGFHDAPADPAIGRLHHEQLPKQLSRDSTVGCK